MLIIWTDNWSKCVKKYRRRPSGSFDTLCHVVRQLASRLEVDPIQVAFMSFSRKRRCQKKIFEKSVKPPKEAYVTFIAAIKKYQPDAPYLEEPTNDEETSSANETENQENSHQSNIIELVRDKLSGITNNFRDCHSIDFKLLNCSLSYEAIKFIESSTKEQAACAMWNHQRKGRVTSLFGKVLRYKTGQKGLVVQILGRNFSNATIEWGENQEAVTKSQFLCYLSEQHVNGMLLPCGLRIDAENIFLGASSDGLVVCHCCEIAVLEIKCPDRDKGLTKLNDEETSSANETENQEKIVTNPTLLNCPLSVYFNEISFQRKELSRAKHGPRSRKKLKKDELRIVAEEIGLVVNEGMKKSELRRLIEDSDVFKNDNEAVKSAVEDVLENRNKKIRSGW
ncbi:hypothetical protein NPIL_419641 [Nephila pilipes]|uniref:YqaJ viral recombinase domain-containing protein n=1 Tax=Nephila pilipes TaxID=299642 RepID=A0A8X6QGB6_NEPPI|nr:hypothetical protein NPIL_419641 [Nephila pilipes]